MELRLAGLARDCEIPVHAKLPESDRHLAVHPGDLDVHWGAAPCGGRDAMMTGAAGYIAFLPEL